MSHMIQECFITWDPTYLIIATGLLTFIAVYLVLFSLRGQRKATLLSAAFLVLSALSLLFILCWAVVVAFIELVVAFLIYKNKLVTLIAE